MATRKENDSSRGRANIMREYMKGNEQTLDFDSEEVMEVLDLCISCKGCKSECPSNVDMTKLKSEYYAQYYKNHRRPLRDRKSTRLNSSHVASSYAVFCLQKTQRKP